MATVDLGGRDMASPDRSMQKWNYATQSLCIGGMTIFFALRVYARTFILNGFNKEDCESRRPLYNGSEVTGADYSRDMLRCLGMKTTVSAWMCSHSHCVQFLGVSYSIVSLISTHSSCLVAPVTNSIHQ